MTSKLTKKIKALAERAKTSLKLRRLKLARRSYSARRNVSRRLGLRKKPFGVNLVAYVRAELGLGEAARGVAAALEAAGVPFGITNYEHGLVSPQTDGSWRHKEVLESDFAVTVLCINPDNTTNLRVQLPQHLLSSRYVIGNWFWEMPEIPDAWTADFEILNEVWAGSRFVQKAVEKKSPLPVVWMPPAVNVRVDKILPRSDFGLPENSFLFLTVCDTRSVLERKNPLGAVRAFRSAFRDDPRASLVIKMNTADFQQQELQKVRAEVLGYDNIFLIDRVLPRSEMNALIATSDCVVSLHRAEGFGLVPAEAMSLGKPTIMTKWSGNTDFMTSDNSIGIDYELVEIGRDYGPYQAHQCWAEPDIEQAAQGMRQLVEEPELAQRLGARAKETMEKEFSPAAVGARIKERLDYIYRNT